MNDRCSRCGADLDRGARICPQCGVPVALQGPAPQDEGTAAKLAQPDPARVQARAAAPRTGPPTASSQAPLPSWVWGGIGLVVLAGIVVGGYLLYTGSLATQPPGAQGTAGQSGQAATAAPSAEVQSVMDLAAQYEALQAKADDTNRQIAGLLAQAQKSGGTLPANFGPNLTDEQRRLLAERIQQEKSGVRDLLQDILAKDQQIQDLRKQSASLEQKLPAYVVAQDGSRHDRIAMDFLIKQGVAAEKAYGVVSSINLEDALLPGYRVWTYYNNGQFGTWVTQGSASVSPQEHQRRVKQLLVDERDQALKTADVARSEAQQSDAQRRQAEQQFAAASAETGAMLKLAEEERAKADALENTIRYAVGPKKLLVDSGVIDKSYRARGIDQIPMLTLNSKESSEIAVDASTHGMKSLKKVTLVPDMFISGTDYEIRRDGLLMQLRILNPAKFRRTQFIIVLE
jgi:hypothetical protein